MKVGDPTSPDTDVGPIIRHKETDRIEEWVNQAVTAGAEKISGSGKLMRKHAFKSHILTKKSKKRKRALGNFATVNDSDEARLKRMI